MHDARPRRAVELVAGDAEQVEVLALVLPARGQAPVDVVDDAHDGDDGRGVDRHVAGLVVERHVAARHRDAQLEAAVGETLDGAGELPHHLGVLGAAEVQAVAHGAAASRPVAATLRYASASASCAPAYGSSWQ